MDIEDAFTEEAVGSSELTEDDQITLRQVAERIYTENKIAEVEETKDVCVLFFAAGAVYGAAAPFVVAMDRTEYAAWVEFRLERGE